ncbi:MAG: LacI family DNA-binding transcriptional regulator [Streptosporangiales bacterium]|nr:LacI family DNA-binding transcriptional regulator [Streptosporangiales bacterium]
MYVSLKDVAARAGVSFQTASKVLNGRRGVVAEETRERIFAAARELGYVPNAVARSLVTRSTYTVGVVADDLSDWVLAQFVVGAEREARRRGHAVLIGTAHHGGPDAEGYLQLLLERRVDGILAAAPNSLEDDERVAELLRGPIPAVGIHHVPGGGVPVVGSDHRLTGRLAAEHLVELGHRRIATVTGPGARRVVASRLRGYRSVLEDAGLPADRMEEGDWTAAGGYAATCRLLEGDPSVTAIFAHNDLMAAGVLSALHRHGRRVPDDCAVVGCDDMPLAAHLIPPLTTVHLPFYETGERAMSLLLGRIGETGEPARRVLLPVHLVVRESTEGGEEAQWPESRSTSTGRSELSTAASSEGSSNTSAAASTEESSTRARS